MIWGRAGGTPLLHQKIDSGWTTASANQGRKRGEPRPGPAYFPRSVNGGGGRNADELRELRIGGWRGLAVLWRAGRWCAPEFSWPRKASEPVHMYPCILTLCREPLAFRKTRNHSRGPASWRSPVPGSHRVFLPCAQPLPSSWTQFLFLGLVISLSRFRVPLWASDRTLNESALIKFQPSKGWGWAGWRENLLDSRLGPHTPPEVRVEGNRFALTDSWPHGRDGSIPGEMKSNFP